nr:hypothetical protein [Micromonospora sp. DSM 115978]
SSHGAEYLRAFLDEVTPAGYRYAASRVYRPTPHAGLVLTGQTVRANVPPGEQVTTVASVPGSWGMVASTGPDPRTAIANVLGLVDVLVADGLASA